MRACAIAIPPDFIRNSTRTSTRIPPESQTSPNFNIPPGTHMISHNSIIASHHLILIAFEPNPNVARIASEFKYPDFHVPRELEGELGRT